MLCALTAATILPAIIRSTIRECFQGAAVPAPQITEEESALLDDLESFMGG